MKGTSLRVLSFIFVSVLLAGCDSSPVTENDEISFDGNVVMADGSHAHVSGEEPFAFTGFDGRHMDSSFYVARKNEPGIIVTIAADLVPGEFTDRDLPMRACSCHLLPGREGDDVVPACADDEERVCVELTATMTGTYENDDCDDEDCLSDLHATFELPPGFEYDGSVNIVHEERWYSPYEHI